MSAPPTSLSEHLSRAQNAASINARARARAYSSQLPQAPLVAHVDYHSRGLVLVIGTAENAASVTDTLTVFPQLQTCVLISDSTQPAGTLEESGSLRLIHGRPDGLSGYLGQFVVTTDSPTLNTALRLSAPDDRPAFDVVLDLLPTPLIRSEIAPPGYYAPRGDATRLREALEEIPTLVGDFEKPRYFRYNPSICAHGRSGISGCTRCLTACPTDAIVSNGDVIQVDPNLCQGAGSCATACPTGAISYGYPAVEDTLQVWRDLLKAFRHSGGEQPVLLVHDAHTGRDVLNKSLSQLPDRCLPVEVEELGSVGLEAWLAALAWGADAVYLLTTSAVPVSVQREIDFQLSVARAVLGGMGMDAHRLRCLSPDELIRTDQVFPDPALTIPATFAALDEKRRMLRLAVEHLAGQCEAPPRPVELPEGAPFGELRVDTERCTLCMACVSQCPSAALAAGDDSPQLRFIEANCVQCGICVRSCPEQAIALRARLIFDTVESTQWRVLNEDRPFCCIRCQKPFASSRVIDRICEKMKQHPMFSGEALSRLQMCEDCRVKAMFDKTSDEISLTGPGEPQ